MLRVYRYKGSYAPKRKLVFVQRPVSTKDKKSASAPAPAAASPAHTAGSEVAAAASEAEDAATQPASTLTKRK